jgi:integrase
VRVTPKARIFIVQWTDPTTKQKIREPLGLWGNITIQQARDAARAKLGDVARGINPRAARLRAQEEAERKRAAATLTFDKLVSDWETLHLSGRRERYRMEATRAIRHAFPDLMKRPAARITHEDTVNALDELVKDGRVVMAGRTLAYARAAFNWALKRRKVPANPFQGLPIAAGATEREQLLTDADLADVWTVSSAFEYPWGPFSQLLLLTLQRREEVAGMRWSEISPDVSLWTLPGWRTKNGKPHDVHLSGPARDVLCSIPRIEGQDLVFSTTGNTPVSGFSKAKSALDAAIVQARTEKAAQGTPAELEPWRLHDIRRTGVTTLARLGFDSIVVDKILAHQPAKLKGVASVYQRHSFAQERAAALDAWAAHILGIEAANVVPLQQAAQ